MIKITSKHNKLKSHVINYKAHIWNMSNRLLNIKSIKIIDNEKNESHKNTDINNQLTQKYFIVNNKKRITHKIVVDIY